MDTATFSPHALVGSIINYLSRQPRSQSAASSRQVLSGRPVDLANRDAARRVVGRNLCQFATVWARRAEEKDLLVEELG